MVTRPKCSRLVTVAKFQDGLPIDEPLQEHSRFELFLIYTQAIILYLLLLRFTFARFLFFCRLGPRADIHHCMPFTCFVCQTCEFKRPRARRICRFRWRSRVDLVVILIGGHEKNPTKNVVVHRWQQISRLHTAPFNLHPKFNENAGKKTKWAFSSSRHIAHVADF